MTDKIFCPACGGTHDPDSDDAYVDYEGYRFRKPFKCMCCGKGICARQFAYGRCCGPCDMGACQTGNRAFRLSAVHERPEWVVLYDRQASIDKFAQAVETEKLEVEAKQ
ncbi:hypothetical protein ES703_45208 [subsurface metagenome]